MAGIGGRIGGQAVEVALAVDIGDPAAAGLADHDVQAVVVVGAAAIFHGTDAGVVQVGKAEGRRRIQRVESAEHGHLLNYVAIYVAT